MKLHRFYVHNIELEKDFWINEAALVHQWTRVLRFRINREIVLFNNRQEEKLYRITKISTDAVHQELITEMIGKKPKTEQDAFDNVTKQLDDLKADPKKIQDITTNEPIRVAAPNTYLGMKGVVGRALVFLDSKLPRLMNVNPLLRKKYKPSDK